MEKVTHDEVHSDSPQPESCGILADMAEAPAITPKDVQLAHHEYLTKVPPIETIFLKPLETIQRIQSI